MDTIALLLEAEAEGGPKTSIWRLGPSTTYAKPLESIATSSGLAGVPHLVMNLPLLSNFWILLFSPKSATYTFPEESIAIPEGFMNCPSPNPLVPHEVIKCRYL